MIANSKLRRSRRERRQLQAFNSAGGADRPAGGSRISEQQANSANPQQIQQHEIDEREFRQFSQEELRGLPIRAYFPRGRRKLVLYMKLENYLLGKSRECLYASPASLRAKLANELGVLHKAEKYFISNDIRQAVNALIFSVERTEWIRRTPNINLSDEDQALFNHEFQVQLEASMIYKINEHVQIC